MFPLFYKHCVIYDMKLYTKDWYEGFMPMLIYGRKLWSFVEFVGIYWYYYEYAMAADTDMNTTNNIIKKEAVMVMIIIFFVLVVLN